jgi:hypothetical protein
MPTVCSNRVNDAFEGVVKEDRTFQPAVLSLWGWNYGTSKMPGVYFRKYLSQMR